MMKKRIRLRRLPDIKTKVQIRYCFVDVWFQRQGDSQKIRRLKLQESSCEADKTRS